MDGKTPVPEQPESTQPTRKYNKLAIVSIVLVLTVILGLVLLEFTYSVGGWDTAILLIIPYVAIILAGIALCQITAKKQKGLWMTIIVLVIGSCPILFLIFMLYYVNSPYYF